MVVVGGDGKPTSDWRRELAHQLTESLAPLVAPIAAPTMARVSDLLAPTVESVNERIAEALAPALASIAAKASATIFTPEFVALLERMREELPANWPDDIDLDEITAVIQDDGIPLVWVPPAAVVEEVLDAADRKTRVDVLLAHSGKLLPDCRRVLDDVHTGRLQQQLPLAPKALDALEQGHHEAAQALAVVVIDATITGWIIGNFERLEEQVRFDPEEIPFDMVRLQAAVAPLRNFKQRYFADKTPRPAGLNRQVTVHYAEAEHFTEGNALVACLLMTSVLRALQDLEDTYATK